MGYAIRPLGVRRWMAVDESRLHRERQILQGMPTAAHGGCQNQWQNAVRLCFAKEGQTPKRALCTCAAKLRFWSWCASWTALVLTGRSMSVRKLRVRAVSAQVHPAGSQRKISVKASLPKFSVQVFCASS